MKSFSDAEVLQLMNEHHQYARDSSKEGKGTGRGAGSAGQAANNWIMWRNEAIKRGLV